MVLNLKLRRAVAYAATGMFFVVAAMGQLQGDNGMSVFVKASVACLVLTVMGMMIAHIVEDAARKPESVPAHARQGRRPAHTAPAQAGERGQR